MARGSSNVRRTFRPTSTPVALAPTARAATQSTAVVTAVVNLAGAAAPVGAVVQHASVYSASYANPTVTLPSPVTPGNMLLLFAGWNVGTDSTTPVISDDDPDSAWKPTRFADIPGTPSYSAGGWRARVHTAGARTVTFAPPTGATFLRVAVVEVSGVNTVDQMVTNGMPVLSTPATIDAGSVTPQSANELVFGWMVGNSTGAVGPPGSGFTSLETVNLSMLQVAVGPPAGTPLAISCTNGTPLDGYVAIGVSLRYSPVPVLEQHGSVSNSGSAASVAVTLPAKIEKGNVVVALASFAGGAGTTVIADDASDTYTTIDSIASAALGFMGIVAWAKVTANGGTTVSLTPDSGHANRSFVRLFVFEYSNAQDFDGAHASADGVSGLAVQTTVTTTHPNAVIAGQGVSSEGTSSGSMLAGSTFREDAGLQGAYDAVALTAGNYTTGFVANTSTPWLANSAAFYAPAVATVGGISVQAQATATASVTTPVALTPTAGAAAQASVTVTTPTPYDGVVDVDSPVSHWKLGASVAVAVDRKQVTDLPVIGSGLAIVSGIVAGNGNDNAITFPGTTARFDANPATGRGVPYNTGTWSIEAWANCAVLTASSFVVYRENALQSLWVSSSNRRWIVESHDGTGVVQAFPAPSTMSLGLTYHVVGTYDGTNLILYVNGVEVARAAMTGQSSSTTAAPNISTDRTGGGFNGTIDEVAWYDHALTAARVLAHYNAGIPGTTAAVLTPQAAQSTGQATALVTAQSKLSPSAAGIAQATALATATTFIAPVAQASTQVTALATAPVTLAPQTVQATAQATVLVTAREPLLSVAGQAATQATMLVTAPVALVPTAQSQSSSTATVLAAGVLAPVAQAATQATCTVTAPQPLAPTAAATAQVTALATAITYLTPQAVQGTTQATALVAAPARLVLNAVQAATQVTALVTAQEPLLSIAAQTQSQATAQVVVPVALVPTVQASAQATVLVTAGVSVTPQAVQAVAQAIATVQAATALAPTAAGASAATARVTVPVMLVPTAAGSSAAIVLVTSGGVSFPALAAAATAATALVTAPTQLTPNAAAAVQATALAKAPVALAPNAQTATQATATVTASRALAPTAAAATQATALVTTSNVPLLNPTAAASTQATATVTATGALVPSAASASQANATVVVAAQFSPLASASAQATAAVFVVALLVPVATVGTQATATVTAAALVVPVAAASTQATATAATTGQLSPVASSSTQATATVRASVALVPVVEVVTEAQARVTASVAVTPTSTALTQATATATAIGQLQPSAQTATSAIALVRVAAPLIDLPTYLAIADLPRGLAVADVPLRLAIAAEPHGLAIQKAAVRGLTIKLEPSALTIRPEAKALAVKLETEKVLIDG